MDESNEQELLISGGYIRPDSLIRQFDPMMASQDRYHSRQRNESYQKRRAQQRASGTTPPIDIQEALRMIEMQEAPDNPFAQSPFEDAAPVRRTGNPFSDRAEDQIPHIIQRLWDLF